MNKLLQNVLIVLAVATIIFCVIGLIDISISEKFEIDEGYNLSDSTNLSPAEQKAEMNRSDQRANELDLFGMLYFVGILLSIIAIVLRRKLIPNRRV